MKKIILLLGLVFILNIVSVSAETLPFNASCTVSEEPATYFTDWYESFDGANRQYYCSYPNSSVMFIQQELLFSNGIPFTATNPDAWTVVGYSQQTGNIREALIEFDYYVASFQGTCVPSLVNNVSGVWNSPQYVLITNEDSNLSVEGTFDDAFYEFNSEITCDQWNTFSHPVKEFTNDFGSSFSGQSKTIGSIGFEAKNIYIKNVRVSGSAGEIVVI